MSKPTSPDKDPPPSSPDPHPHLDAIPAVASQDAIPPPSKPTIRTQAASSSNILSHPSLSRTHTNTHLQPPLPEEQEQQQQPRPPFTPLFTLINDVGTGSTYHPLRMHYLFSDDEDGTNSELLTAAILRSASQSTSSTLESRHAAQDNTEESATSGTSSSSSATFRKDGSVKIPRHHRKDKGKQKEKNNNNNKAREERVIIVDINSTGDRISGISSLSPHWQILNAELSSAPTWDGGGGEGDETPGLMLRIEGTGIPESGEAELEEEEKVGLGIGKGNNNNEEREIGEEEMQLLLEGFDRKMSVLRGVMGGLSTARERAVSGDSTAVGDA